jgi:hypothetical protein
MGGRSRCSGSGRVRCWHHTARVPSRGGRVVCARRGHRRGGHCGPRRPRDGRTGKWDHRHGRRARRERLPRRGLLQRGRQWGPHPSPGTGRPADAGCGDSGVRHCRRRRPADVRAVRQARDACIDAEPGRCAVRRRPQQLRGPQDRGVLPGRRQRRAVGCARPRAGAADRRRGRNRPRRAVPGRTDRPCRRGRRMAPRRCDVLVADGAAVCRRCAGGECGSHLRDAARVGRNRRRRARSTCGGAVCRCNRRPPRVRPRAERERDCRISAAAAAVVSERRQPDGGPRRDDLHVDVPHRLRGPANDVDAERDG